MESTTHVALYYSAGKFRKGKKVGCALHTRVRYVLLYTWYVVRVQYQHHTNLYE